MRSLCVYCGAADQVPHADSCPANNSLRQETGFSSPVLDTFDRIELKNHLSRAMRPRVQNVRAWWLQTLPGGTQTPLQLLNEGRVQELLDYIEQNVVV